MITIELIRLVHEGHPCEPQLVARASADGAELRVDGPEPDVVDREQRVLNLRTGETITCADNAEEWVRGLAVAFRTPYLSARVLEDTHPPQDVEIARAEVREPVFR